MQNVRFHSVDDFLAFLPDDELKVTEYLRRIVFDCIPEVKEKLSFNVPFYSVHKGICFIWPASVLWGKKQTYTGVRFGFQYGCLLTDDTQYFDKGKRKQITWREFKSTRDINTELLRSYIFEAVFIDGQHRLKKQTK